MRIKLSGFIFAAFNSILLYNSFCPLWAKVNIVLCIISLILGLIAGSLINDTDKAFHALGLGNTGYNSGYKTFGTLCGLFAVLEIVSSIILGIYFLFSL